MIIYPAIDLRGGEVVRLFQGDFSASKTYSRDPVQIALEWAGQGAEILHVVDLDGAAQGVPSNLEVVRSIVQKAKVPVQCGGGVRSLETVRMLLDAGVSRVVLGTKAVEDKDFLEAAYAAYGAKVIVSLDARQGILQVRGWQEKSAGIEAVVFAAGLKALGFTEVIYTDISKDGTLKGPNISEMTELARSSGLRVIASGGVSSLDDIRRLAECEGQGISGVIVGKALYEHRFTLTEALRAA
jgi:phosphoribosylformimino-5-aminoimidazole carboxamide ribotide isomerase